MKMKECRISQTLLKNSKDLKDISIMFAIDVSDILKILLILLTLKFVKRICGISDNVTLEKSSMKGLQAGKGW